jgi:DNA-binding cell septation regulator SpoVG
MRKSEENNFIKKRSVKMTITKITVALIKDKARLKGTASIVFDDVFKVRDILILPRNNNGDLFIAMPSKKLNDEHRISYAYPVTSEYREELEAAVLAEYRKKLAEEAEAGTADKKESSPKEAPEEDPEEE